MGAYRRIGLRTGVLQYNELLAWKVGASNGGFYPFPSSGVNPSLSGQHSWQCTLPSGKSFLAVVVLACGMDGREEEMMNGLGRLF